MSYSFRSYRVQVSLFLWSPGQCTRVGFRSLSSCELSGQSVLVDIVCPCGIIPVCPCGYHSSLSLWVSFQSVLAGTKPVSSSKPFCHVNIRSVCCYGFQVGLHIVLNIRSVYFCGSVVFLGLSLNIINYVSLPTCILGVLVRNYDYTSLICTAG